MIDNEQLIVLLVLFVGFVFLIVFIRLWPFKVKKNTSSVLKYSKLNILTGQITELDETELRTDISVLTNKGYEMVLLTELSYFTENNIKPCKKMFLILNNSEPNHFAEVITKKVIVLNADVIFYKPVIVTE